jgi:PEP-CTERM motif
MKSITNRLVAATALLAAAFATAGGAQAAGNLVVNGSFEAQAQANGSWNVYNTLPGWTTVSGSGIELRNGVAGNAFDGNNYVELDAYSNSAMAQTVATTAGAFYTLSFEYSARGGVAASSNPIDVFWNGSLLGSAALNGIGQSGNVWHQYSFIVQGTGSDTLRFAAGGVSDSLGGSLDAVSITAVPEPSTYLMMFGGLLLIGFSLRSRRNKR